LCPPRLRPPIGAIYWFARTADDLADEGNAPPEQRLADLADYRGDLFAVAQGQAPSGRWPQVFTPLARALAEFALPTGLLADLLDAFVQDVQFTASGRRYADDAELHDYCRRSANPVGRLLLHLYGITDAPALQQSDAICSALQLVNFWQDLSVDGPRHRHYVPQTDLAAHGLAVPFLTQGQDSPASRRLVADLCAWASDLMHQGAPLALRVPGRAGWELRLVVQGGLRILEKIARMDHAALSHRPTVGATDAPLLLWRAWRMGTERPRS